MAGLHAGGTQKKSCSGTAAADKLGLRPLGNQPSSSQGGGGVRQGTVGENGGQFRALGPAGNTSPLPRFHVLALPQGPPPSPAPLCPTFRSQKVGFWSISRKSVTLECSWAPSSSFFISSSSEQSTNLTVCCRQRRRGFSAPESRRVHIPESAPHHHCPHTVLKCHVRKIKFQ